MTERGKRILGITTALVVVGALIEEAGHKRGEEDALGAPPQLGKGAHGEVLFVDRPSDGSEKGYTLTRKGPNKIEITPGPDVVYPDDQAGALVRGDKEVKMLCGGDTPRLETDSIPIGKDAGGILYTDIKRHEVPVPTADCLNNALQRLPS
ncbi:MAG: hypothetical protein ACREHC_00460 [Candidatus Levyibacteriota bacterium]